MSIAIMVTPACLGAAGSVRTVARPHWQCWARLVTLSGRPASRRHLAAVRFWRQHQTGFRQEGNGTTSSPRSTGSTLPLVVGAGLGDGQRHPTGDAHVGM